MAAVVVSVIFNKKMGRTVPSFRLALAMAEANGSI